MATAQIDSQALGILIAPSHLHSPLRIQMAKQGTAHVKLVDLHTYLAHGVGEEIEREAILLEYRKALRTYRASVYASLIEHYDFIAQCYTLIEDLKLYGIQPCELPEKTAAQRELKAMIALLYPIRSWQDQENERMAQITQSDLHNVWILEQMWSAQEDYRIRKLLALGAHLHPLSFHKPKMTYTHTINPRKECEALAQRIIAQDLRVSEMHILVCDPLYQALLVQVFERYHIPLTLLHQTNADSLYVKAGLLLRYAYERKREILFELVELGVFAIPWRAELCEYMRLFAKQVEDGFTHVREFAKPSQLLSEDECERLIRLEQRAAQAQSELLEQLAPIHAAKQLPQLLIELDHRLSAGVHGNDAQELRSLANLRKLFSLFSAYGEQREDLLFLIDLCAAYKSARSAERFCGAWVSELGQPLYGGEICVVLGAAQGAYPAFPLAKGLFDEAYLSEITRYPSMHERHQRYMKQLERCLFSYPELIVSYPLGTYEGKGKESALEMDQLLQGKAQYLEVVEHYHALPLDTTLNSSSARSLFMRENELRGSISSLETYVRCPFSYFLKYGLRIREPIDYRFSQSRIGTLAHYVLETLVLRYGKEYGAAERSEVEEILHEQLDALSDVYVLLKDRLSLLNRRLADALITNLQDLKESEAHSQLAPIACEHEFYQHLELRNGIVLRLHGFIDRIDANRDHLRIIDYKSSMKELKADQVFAGLQLQLVLYALYAKQNDTKRVLGAFYRSLKKENITVLAGKMNRRSRMYLPQGRAEWEMERSRKHRLRGWVFDDQIGAADDNGSHIVGVSQNKDGVVKARTLYPLEQLEPLCMEMLAQLAERILAGEITCAPIKDACLFCPYHSICRFNGYMRDPQPLVDGSGLSGKGGA